MAILLNINSGKQEQVSDDQIPGLLAAGTHKPADGRALISPDGQLGTMPTAEVQNALATGYKVPTQGQLDEFAAKAKYGGDVNAAKAFGLGLLRGPTLAGSDVALTKTGLVDPETIAGLESHHPAASITGELIGTGAAALLAPEVEGPLAAADLANPVAGIARLGRGVAKDVAGEGAGALRTVLGKTVGGAVEGAAFNEAATTLHETALGDPDLTAEKLIGNLGLGALVGGGLGAIGGVGSIALKESATGAKDALEKGWGKLFGEPPVIEGAEATPGAIPKVIANAKEALTGTPAAETLEAFANRHNIESLSAKEYDSFARELRDSIQEAHDSVSKAAGKAGGLVRPQESALLLEDVAPGPAHAEVGRVKKVMETAIEELRNEPDLYPARFARNLELVSEGLDRGLSPEATAADLYSELSRTKSILDDKIPWKAEARNAESAGAISLLKDVRSTLKDSLENQNVWGEAGARSAAFNESAHQQIKATETLRREFMVRDKVNGGYKVSGTKVKTFLNQIKDVRGEPKAEAIKDFFAKSLGHIDEIEKAYSHAPHETFDKETLENVVKKTKGMAERAQNVVSSQHPDLGYGGMHNLFTLSGLGKFVTDPAKLAAMESLAKTTSSRIERAAKVLFRPVEKAASKGKGILAESLAPAERVERVKKRINEARQNVSSPEEMIARLDHATSAGAHAAPKTMAAIQAASLRGFQFLASKAPVLEPPSIFDKAPEPTPQQIDTFDRYYEAVHDPLVALNELKHGVLHPETLETLQVVYPKLYREMQTAMIDGLTSMKDASKVPYSTRILLSKFMGQPLDPSLQPGAMQQMQMAMAMPEQKQGPAPHPTQGGLSQLTIAQRSSTDFQKPNLGSA